jgi:chemotaxis protein CheX
MSEPQILTLSDSLGMTAAGPLVRDLLERRGQPITLDASQVRRVGGQCLQVLLSAQAAWAADGAVFQIVDPSPEFADGLALMGATELCMPAPGDQSLVQD